MPDLRLNQGDSQLPDGFVAALDAVPQAKWAFQRAPALYQEGLLDLVSGARDDNHRRQRIDLVIRTLVQQGRS